MPLPELVDLLSQDLAQLGLDLPAQIRQAELQYLEQVLVANETMNLTAITDPVEAVRKHLVDSLSALLLTEVAAQSQRASVWADVGSGAGFPGLALGLAAPGSLVHLIESTGKKAHFLNTTAAALGILRRITVHNSRAELLGLDPSQLAKSAKDVPRGTNPTSLRSSCDAVFFRGVSRLNALVELGAPLLKINGILVAYKGPKGDEELAEAGKAMKELHLSLLERRALNLPGVNDGRLLICLKKVGETPRRFPRPVGLAQKEPIL